MTAARTGQVRTDAPARADIEALATYTWLETTAVGRMAVALLVDPRGGPAAGRVARALGLGAPSEGMPWVGARISVAGGLARLRLDECGYAVELAAGPQWAAFVAGGGPVLLAAGLDPLPQRVPPSAVTAYLARARLRTGTTAV